MPVKVYKRGKQFCVMEAGKGGSPKKGRCHSSKAKASAQARAINASLSRQGKI